MFAAPNSSSIMSSVPASQRGAASGMRATFQNSGTALSIGIFFSLMVMGLSSSLPASLSTGLRQHGVSAHVASQIAALPRVSSLFAAVLGVNPVQHLLASNGALGSLSSANQQVLTGREFFPNLLSGPFHQGLIVASRSPRASACWPHSPRSSEKEGTESWRFPFSTRSPRSS